MLNAVKSELVAGVVASCNTAGTSPERHHFAIVDQQHPGLMMTANQSADYDMTTLDMIDAEPFTFDEFMHYENKHTRRQKQQQPLSPTTSIPEMLSPVSTSEVESGYESVGSPSNEPLLAVTRNMYDGPITDLFPDLI